MRIIPRITKAVTSSIQAKISYPRDYPRDRACYCFCYPRDYSSGVLGSPTSVELGLSQTTTVGLLYPRGDKSRESLLYRSLSFANCKGLESS